MRRIFFMLMAALLATAAGTQIQADYRQRQLTMDNGLSSNSVHAILQDQRGFVWIGTEGGLGRYNGIAVQYFPIGVDGSEQAVQALLPTGEDGLYVSTVHNVSLFDHVTEQFTTTSLETEKTITGMATDKEENLWVSTQGEGVLMLGHVNETVTNYNLKAIDGDVAGIYVDNDNQVWALSLNNNNPLWRLNKSKELFEAVVLKSDQPYGAACMVQTSDGKRWIGTWEHGLMLMRDDGSLEQMPAPQSGHLMHIHTLADYAAGQVLVGCDDGLWLFDSNQRTYTSMMTQRFVFCTMTDREGGLWAGTHYAGVVYLSPIARRFDAVVGGMTPAFCEDAHHRVWIANDESGVSCWRQGQRITSFPGSEKVKHLNVQSICIDGDNLWIGTYAEGVFVLHTTTGELTHIDSGTGQKTLNVASVRVIFRSSKGQIWVGTDEQLCRYDRQTRKLLYTLKLSAIPLDIDEDSKGRLWISTRGKGMVCYSSDGQVKNYRHHREDQNTLSDDMVNCAVIDGEGVLWAGTQRGLCRYDANKDRFTRVRLDVPKAAVSSIVEDQDVLWLAGDFGVLKMVSDKDMQRFTRHDGLVSEQFLPNASLKASDGCVYFGTVSGFNSFYPFKIKVNQQLSPVYITQLEIFNHPVEVGNWRLPKSLADIRKIELWSNDQMISLAFASLSYCSPEKNIYAYRLEGFDRDWHYVGHDHKATYTNLPEGEYVFKVKGTNNDGIWSNHEAQLIIEVHPPFWWSLTAKICYVLLIIGIVFAYIWLRLKIVERRHRKEMAQLNAEKEQEMRNARMEFFTMIAHEIRTPVSLIIAPLEQLKKTGTGGALLDTIDRNAHRLLELVNQLLDFRKVEQNQMEMDFKVQKITPLLRSVADNFVSSMKLNGRRLEGSYPDESFTAAIDREAIVKMVSNLLSNANKYARDCVKLNARLLDDGQHFSIEVSDNGEGISEEDRKRVFEPFFQARNSKAGTGIGLSLVKHIAEMHNGSVSVASEIGQGTTFRVVLPIVQETAAEMPAETAAENVQNTPQEGNTVQSHKFTMLIVDDNEEMQNFLVSTFMDDYEVLSARDGKEALEIIKNSLVLGEDHIPTSTIDIVLSDWMMIEMDGPELCQRIRQNQGTSHIPFVLLTAKTDSQSKVQAMEAGVDMYIEKPFAVKYLEASIRNLLRRNPRIMQHFEGLSTWEKE